MESSRLLVCSVIDVGLMGTSRLERHFPPIQGSKAGSVKIFFLKRGGKKKRLNHLGSDSTMISKSTSLSEKLERWLEKQKVYWPMVLAVKI
jgi:hypothetical protein